MRPLDEGVVGAFKYLASTFYLFVKKGFCALYYTGNSVSPKIQTF